MKKVFLIAISFVLGAGKLFAGDGPADSKFRFGLKMAPSVTWMKSDDTKKLDSDGAALKFAYGLTAEFRLTSVASFCTGVEVNYSGGRLNFTNPADSIYYDPSEYTIPLAGTSDKFFLTQRTYNITYVDLPVLLKMKTPEVGGFTYFGLFGLNLSIRAKVKANDIGTLVTYKDSGTASIQQKVTNAYEIPDLIVTKDMNFFRAGLNVGAGAEYRIAGSTSVFVSLNFQNGFTNVLKKESENMISKTKRQAFAQNAKTNFFQINIGVLF
jgi:hypothetical protein